MTISKAYDLISLNNHSKTDLDWLIFCYRNKINELVSNNLNISITFIINGYRICENLGTSPKERLLNALLLIDTDLYKEMWC